MVAQYEVKTVFKILFTVPLIIAVLFLVFSYFLSLPLGLALFFFTPPRLDVSRLYLLKLPIPLFLNPDFSIPATINAGLVFLFLLGVYTLCFASAWMSRESLHSIIRKGFSRPLSQLFNNNLFAMPIITSMLFIAFIIIHVFLGVPTGPGPFEPSEDPIQPFKDFFAVTYSPLVEEIGFRVIPIGIFLIAYLFVIGRERMGTLSGGEFLKVLFLIPLHPDKAKELLGVRTVREFGIRGISLAEWIMIVFTSVAFGLVHIGGGWEAGKSISASINGLAFGLVYLLYGVQAPILLHWFFNYYISGYGAYGLALDFYPIISPIFLLIFLATLILGVLGWIMFTALLGARIYRRRKRVVPPQPLPLSPPTPPQPITRFCRQCGRLLSENTKFCPYCGKSMEEEA
ncbi:MAG: type II CAAX prenyl endopeptidase Rce1 family protein [Candidatus Bathyarchaeia archaeon]